MQPSVLFHISSTVILTYNVGTYITTKSANRVIYTWKFASYTASVLKNTREKYSYCENSRYCLKNKPLKPEALQEVTYQNCDFGAHKLALMIVTAGFQHVAEAGGRGSVLPSYLIYHHLLCICKVVGSILGPEFAYSDWSVS
jgi:hypothetical protein